MGAGINLFKQLFPEDYYTYQTAHLESAKPTSKVVVGFNQWDEEWKIKSSAGVEYLASKNPIPVFPNTTYYIKTPTSTSIDVIDENDTYISFIGNRTNATFVTPSNCHFIRIATPTVNYGNVYNHDICVNISDASKNGTYEPYSKTTYPLGGDELRGLLKVENGKLVAYGDVKGSDGIIYRYFEERAYASGDESLPNAITDGTNTVVELATPTTASGTPFTNPMLCGSTEEFTDSRSLKMFCGHDSLYYNSPFKGW